MDLDASPTRSPGETADDRHAATARVAAARQRTRKEIGLGQPRVAEVSAARLRLRVTSSAGSILRSGHPWLFAGSLREQNRDGEIGELAVIYDRRDQFLAVGLYDPTSPI